MDVYFRPFIKPKNPARDVRTPPEKQGCADLERRVATARLSVCLSCDWSLLDGTRQGEPPTPIGWLPSSFLTVPKEPGYEFTPCRQLVRQAEAHSPHRHPTPIIYQDQADVDEGWPHSVKLVNGAQATTIKTFQISKSMQRTERKATLWTLAKSCGRVFSRKGNEAYQVHTMHSYYYRPHCFLLNNEADSELRGSRQIGKLDLEVIKHYTE